MEVAILITASVLALLVSGLVGTVESALTSISAARVDNMARDEVPGARALAQVISRRSAHINLMVLLRTVLDAAAAVFAAAAGFRLFDADGWAYLLAISFVTLLSFAVIGVFARTMGRKNPYSISLRTASLIKVTYFILGPISRLLIWLGNLLAPGNGFRDGPYATEVELREMVDIAQEHGIVEVEERRMIQSVFDLADQTARQVMVPRPEMVWIESDKNAGQATSLAVRSGLSRIPVIGESVDDILGVIYLKDLVRQTYHRTDGGRGVPVTEVMRPAFFVPDSLNLDVMLHTMQRDKVHLAILIDEYGGVAGLMTLEDILEEIVGEIADEYDAAEVAPIERIDDRTYRVVSRLSLEDLSEQLEDDHDVKLRFDEDIEDQVETVAGLVAYQMGKVPLAGSSVVVEGLKLTADVGKDRRGRLRVLSVIVEVLDDAFDMHRAMLTSADSDDDDE